MAFRLSFVSLFLVALTISVYAQSEDYLFFEATGHGFSLKLPPDGEVVVPSYSKENLGTVSGVTRITGPDGKTDVYRYDTSVSISVPNSNWDNDQEVAFEWYGGPESPVVLIQARVDDLGSEIDSDTFRMFADALLANWAPDPEAEAQVGPFEVLNAADNLQINARTWNLIEVADRSAADTPVYYSVFSTYEGRRIFTVTLYYLEPNMEQVQQFGRPVLQDFSVL